MKRVQPPVAPGPRRLARLRTLLLLQRSVLDALRDAARRYGEFVELDLFSVRAFLLTRPEHVREVLHQRPESFPGAIAAGRGRLLGQGLAMIEGDTWRRHRRLIQPAFHQRRLESLLGMMGQATGEMLAGWEAAQASGEPVDLVLAMRRLTLSIALRAIFGSGFAGEEEFHRAWYGVTDDLRRHPLHRRLHRLLTPARRSVDAHLDTLDRLTFEAIRQRRAEGEDRGDMLSMLLLARDETGEGLSDQEARDEVMNIFFGAYDTTTTAMVWSLALAAEHPAEEARLGSEAVAVLGPGRAPGLEDLPRLGASLEIFQEAMRLYPPAPAFGRVAETDTEIGGFPVPAGASILLCPYLTHRHPDCWDDPERFRPERFRPENSRGRDPFSYIPFGRGPRQCIGGNFALMEGQTSLSMIAARFRVKPRRRLLPPQEGGLTRPAAGFLADLSPRAGSGEPEAAGPKNRQGAGRR